MISNLSRLCVHYNNSLKENVSLESEITFAWEERNDGQYFWDTIKQSISFTNILVVIGYSFPFFNRQIDRQLINSCPLKKVYIQAPKDSSQEIKERFQTLIDPVNHLPEIEIINGINQFYFPAELNI